MPFSVSLFICVVVVCVCLFCVVLCTLSHVMRLSHRVVRLLSVYTSKESSPSSPSSSFSSSTFPSSPSLSFDDRTSLVCRQPSVSASLSLALVRVNVFYSETTTRQHKPTRRKKDGSPNKPTLKPNTTVSRNESLSFLTDRMTLKYDSFEDHSEIALRVGEVSLRANHHSKSTRGASSLSLGSGRPPPPPLGPPHVLRRRRSSLHAWKSTGGRRG